MHLQSLEFLLHTGVPHDIQDHWPWGKLVGVECVGYLLQQVGYFLDLQLLFLVGAIHPSLFLLLMREEVVLMAALLKLCFLASS